VPGRSCWALGLGNGSGGCGHRGSAYRFHRLAQYCWLLRAPVVKCHFESLWLEASPGLHVHEIQRRQEHRKRRAFPHFDANPMQEFPRFNRQSPSGPEWGEEGGFCLASLFRFRARVKSAVALKRGLGACLRRGTAAGEGNIGAFHWLSRNPGAGGKPESFQGIAFSPNGKVSETSMRRVLLSSETLA